MEPAGHGIETGERRSAETWPRGDLLRHESRTMMQTDEGQIEESPPSLPVWISRPSGPQHAFLNSTGRADYVSITDDEALEAFKTLCRSEGSSRH